MPLSDITRPDGGPFVIAGVRRHAFGTIRMRAARAARGLRAAGAGPDAPVALMLRNGVESIEAALAAKHAGAASAPLDPALAPEMVAIILRDCAASALVIDADLLEPLRSRLPPGLPVIAVAAGPHAPATGNAWDWDDFIAAHLPLEHAAAMAPPVIIHTSGSTGRPKGVRRPAAPVGAPSARALATYGLDRSEGAVVLITGPLHHAVPNALARVALATGADIVLPTSFEPDALLALVARHRVTHMHVVPSLMLRWQRLPGAVRARHDVSTLRHVVHGGAPCPPMLKRACIDWWGPILHEYYGSTETGLLTLHNSAEALAKPGTVGRALPGITLEVRDPDGTVLPPCRSGQVYACSDTMRGFRYLGVDAGPAVADGDLVTAGDIGFLDQDGYLFLQGRARDVVTIDARPVYPSQVEALALDCPAVGDAAAFGIVSAEGAAMLCLCVEPAPGETVGTSALRQQVEAAMPSLRGRLLVEVVADLPRQATGKMLKALLRAHDQPPA